MIPSYLELAVVPRRSKTDLSLAISQELQIPTPSVSTGSSVDTNFLTRILQGMDKDAKRPPNAYRAVEEVLKGLGLQYDPTWDSSESQEITKGGSTVTARSYSKILSAINGSPRCFAIVGPAELATRGQMEIERPRRRNALIEAGPGACLLFLVGQSTSYRSVGLSTLRTVRAARNRPSVWEGPWRLEWEDPIPFEYRVDTVGKHASRIIEFSPGSLPNGAIQRTKLRETVQENEVSRVLNSIAKVGEVPLTSVLIPDPVLGTLPLSNEIVAEYGHDLLTDAPQATLGTELGTSDKRQVALTREIEQAAIRTTIRLLEDDGWTLSRDMQLEGVGYDLLFSRGRRRLHVEVKGLSGRTLRMNLTAKELWRARTDPDWILIAVTSALSGASREVHVLDRATVCQANRRATTYEIEANL